MLEGGGASDLSLPQELAVLTPQQDHKESEDVTAGRHFLGIRGLRGADSGARGWWGASEVTSCPKTCSYREMMSLLVT